MKIEAAEVRVLALPMRRPFVASHGVVGKRDAVLVRLRTDAGDGWGECVAPSQPGYTSEHAASAAEALRRLLLPAVVGSDVNAEGISALLAGAPGHHMAKAAVEVAALDAGLRAQGTALAPWLGGRRRRVEAGAAVGIAGSVGALVDEVAAVVAAGHRRVKLKVRPGWDVEPAAAVVEHFPGLSVQVDANGAYEGDDGDHRRALRDLDRLGLLLLEQPLRADDLDGHARLAAELVTPVCLDESITSVEAAERALDKRACSIVCVKPGSVGGWLEARRIHDLCVERGIPAWCGGMHESSLGRAALAALASLPGFTLPGDLSAPATYLEVDITVDPFTVVDGWVDVPVSPGAGAVVDLAAVDALTVARDEVR